MSTGTLTPTAELQPLLVEGTGLITGLPVQVRIEPAAPGQGIVFHLENELPVPARLESVVNTERGVTLAHPSGKFLSIVEHFLCACSLAGLQDLNVYVSGGPELPILDGSADLWLSRLTETFGEKTVEADIPLTKAVFHRHDDNVCIYAIPSDRFRVTYAVDFPHPGLNNLWIRWDSKDGADGLAPARTFGFLRELPYLQAKGLAKGVSLDNTLGLTDDGGYTTPLRFDEEPAFHKMIDLIGDLTLSGLNPLRLKAHVFAFNAGHDSHTAFAKKLLKAL